MKLEKKSHSGRKCLKHCLKYEQGRFIRPRFKITRSSRVALHPIKQELQVFLNGLKDIFGKAWVNRQLCFCERWKLAYQNNIRH